MSVSGSPAIGRTAFQSWLVHDHKNRLSAISAIAVEETGERLYLGLTDGQLEEYKIINDYSFAKVSLSARKHVGKKPVAAIHHLPQAGRLAVLCDGVVTLLDQETLDGHVLAGVKGVTATAVDGYSRLPPTLAVALKHSKRAVRVLVYEVYASSSAAAPFKSTALCINQVEMQETLPIQEVCWLGGNLLMCTSVRYMLLNPSDGAVTQLFEITEDAMSPAIIQPIPDAAQAVLLMNDVGVVVNDSGAPCANSLTFPSPPLSLAHSGLFLLAVCHEGVMVYDRTTSQCVQQLGFGDNLKPAPGQTIRMADNFRGTHVAMAGYRKVWLLLPVALEDQARELLRRHRFGEALELTATCSQEGAPWTDTAFAQAAFLMMQELRFEDAVSALHSCSIATFQPVELFRLFPDYTTRWAAMVPVKAYWGLHSPLPELRSLVRRWVSHAAQRKGVAAMAGEGLAALVEEEVAARMMEAKRAVVAYLKQARTVEGVDHVDGVDTLLLALIVDIQDAQQLEEFAASHNQVVVSEVEGGLTECHHYHALALLWAGHNMAGRALALWRGIAQGSLHEQPAQGAEMFKEGFSPSSVAVSHAAGLLSDEGRVTDTLALEYLSWMLNASHAATLSVLQCRSLPVERVLVMLIGEHQELRMSYLEHVVVNQGTQEGRYHTQFALSLAAAVVHDIKHSNGNGTGPSRASTSADSHVPPRATPSSPMRIKFRQFLEDSSLYDVPAVLKATENTPLWEERVVLHRKAGDHYSALRILALVLCDIRSAEEYCSAHVGQEGYLALLDMLLHPGAGRKPLYHEACHLLAAQGALLDPLKVLDALSEDMPLGVGLTTLIRMLQERLHRRRQGLVLRNLERSHHLAVAAERAEVMSRRVLITDQRVCRVCGSRIGTKMFSVYPNGIIVCFKCFRNGSSIVCPVTGTDFGQQQHQQHENWGE